MDILERLRDWTNGVRRKPQPLADVIPMVQEAADTIEALRAKLEVAVFLLAEWCVAIDANGSGWDDWDEHYKNAAFRPGPLRAELDAAIAEVRETHQL